MYEVRCTVSDAKLASVLTALKGLSFGRPTVSVAEDWADPTPAKTVIRKGYVPFKRKKPIIQGSPRMKGKGATQIILDFVAKTGATQITAREMRAAVEAAGYSKGSYSHGIKVLLTNKTLKQVDSFGHYEVVKPDATQAP